MGDSRKVVGYDEAGAALMDAEPVAAEAPTANLPEASTDELPTWAVVPSGLKPPRGRNVLFLRIPADFTDTPYKGERQCTIWTLSDGDEKMALRRCQGDPNRAASEYTRQMLRAVDGVVSAWDKPAGPGSVDEFWREIGAKGRNMLMRVYTQLHLPTDAEMANFFEHCVAVRTAS